jgi:hypothetical protein
MTHDELLKEVNQGELGWFYGWMQNALRAVVELHKPCTNGALLLDYSGPIWGNCEGCRNTGSKIKWENCPTIQAIEKELK